MTTNVLDWLGTEGNHVLITGNMSNGNALLRKLAIHKGVKLWGVSCTSIRQILDELLLAKGEQLNVLDDGQGVLIVEDILYSNCPSFIPVNSMCRATSVAVLKAINQLRMGKTTAVYDSDKGKIDELKLIIEQYESRCTDYIGMLKKAIEMLEQCSIEEFKMLLPRLANCNLAVLEDARYSYLEESFIKLLSKITGQQIQRIELALDESRANSCAYKAYGKVNELDYIAKIIEKKNICYGDVNIYYISDEYEQIIKAVLDSRGIPYNCVNGASAREINLVQWMLDFLAFLELDYGDEVLMKVKKNPVTIYKVVIEEEKIDKIRAAANIAECYDAILDCVAIYTKKNSEQAYIMDTLKQQKEVWKCITRTMSFGEMIDNIRQFVEGIRYSEPEKNDEVNVVALNDYEITDRSYNFIVGLSAKAMIRSSFDSPVLRDEELVKYLGDTARLSSDEDERFKDILNKLVITANKGYVYYSYAFYDTVEFREVAASSFYQDHCQDEDKYDEYDIWQDSIEMTRSVYKEEEISDSEQDDMENDSTKDKLYMSATGLQTLIACPWKYYYHYKEYLPDIEHREYNASKWLDADKKGTLFHRIMEEYCNKVFGTEVCKGKTFNAAIFEGICEEQITKMREEQKCMSDTVYNEEKTEMRNFAKRYLLNLHEEYNNADVEWQILGNEISFNEVPYLKEDKYAVYFRGAIDRLDGYFKDGKWNLRVVDYKTGAKEKLVKKIKEKSVIQHCVYYCAALEYAKANGWEECGNIAVSYVFPFDNDMEHRCETREIQAFPDNAEFLLENVIGLEQKGDMEAAKSNTLLYVASNESAIDENCKYCNYKNICRRMV